MVQPAQRHRVSKPSDFPYATSEATLLFAQAIKRAVAERQCTLAQLAHQLGYSQGVALSHMTLGRAPIPVERSKELAEALGIPEAKFIRAVLKQRHPEIDWVRVFTYDASNEDSDLIEDLETASGSPVSELNPGQRRVMREVAIDRHAERRWISLHELRAILVIRDVIPDFPQYGLLDTELERLRAALGSKDK